MWGELSHLRLLMVHVLYNNLGFCGLKSIVTCLHMSISFAILEHVHGCDVLLRVTVVTHYWQSMGSDFQGRPRNARPVHPARRKGPWLYSTLIYIYVTHLLAIKSNFHFEWWEHWDWTNQRLEIASRKFQLPRLKHNLRFGAYQPPSAAINGFMKLPFSGMVARNICKEHP